MVRRQPALPPAPHLPADLRVTRDKISALQACLRSLRNPAAQSSLEAQLEALRQRAVRAGWLVAGRGMPGALCATASWLVGDA